MLRLQRRIKLVRSVHVSRLDMKVSACAELKLLMIFRLTSQHISTYLCQIWRVETLTAGRMKPRARATPPVWENLLLQNRCSSSHLQYASCHKRSSRLALIKFCFYLAVPIVYPLFHQKTGLRKKLGWSRATHWFCSAKI